MTITVNPVSTAFDGVPLHVSGTLWPYTDAVKVGISTSNMVPPMESTQLMAPSGFWSLYLTPTWTGAVYVWAQQVTPDLPRASLSISRDRGYSFGDPRIQSIGTIGQRKTVVQFWRLGLGRDVVFKLNWSSPSRTALQGAFIEVEPCAT